MVCGKPAVVSCYCQEHYDKRMRKLREDRGDDYRPQTCRICGEEGHNARTCPNADREETSSESR
jgi:predicted SprT family Zn-dependent metalloprotease